MVQVVAIAPTPSATRVHKADKKWHSGPLPRTSRRTMALTVAAA